MFDYVKAYLYYTTSLLLDFYVLEEDQSQDKLYREKYIGYTVKIY